MKIGVPKEIKNNESPKITKTEPNMMITELDVGASSPFFKKYFLRSLI